MLQAFHRLSKWNTARKAAAAQREGLRRQLFSLRFGVIAEHAQKNEQPLIDARHGFAVDGDRRAGNALTQSPHRTPLPRGPAANLPGDIAFPRLCSRRGQTANTPR